jgi:hypothetical protein
MSGDEDLARGEVEATVPLVVMRVTKEHTTCGAGCQLVRSSGTDVRVTGTAEDTKVIVAGRCTKESMVRGGSWGGSRRKTASMWRYKDSPHVRMISFVVQIIYSALPFWGEVYGQDMRS